MAADEISGINQRRKGVIKREVCSADIKSVEPRKISAIQSTTGSQDLMSPRKFKPRILASEGCLTNPASRVTLAANGTNARSAATLRAALHGADLGRARAGATLWKEIAAGEKYWRIM